MGTETLRAIGRHALCGLRFADLPSYATMPNASGHLADLTPTPSHSAQPGVILAGPPKTGGRGLEIPGCAIVKSACQPASPCVVPAGNPSAGYGGRCVEALRLPV